jgi:hypothetical protein
MGAVSEPIGVRRTVKEFVAPKRAVLPSLLARAADLFTVPVTPMISPRAYYSGRPTHIIISCLRSAFSCALKMEAVRSSETLVRIYHIPKDIAMRN